MQVSELLHCGRHAMCESSQAAAARQAHLSAVGAVRLAVHHNLLRRHRLLHRVSLRAGAHQAKQPRSYTCEQPAGSGCPLCIRSSISSLKPTRPPATLAPPCCWHAAALRPGKAAAPHCSDPGLHCAPPTAPLALLPTCWRKRAPAQATQRGGLQVRGLHLFGRGCVV